MKVDGRKFFRHVKKKDNKTQVFTNEEVSKIEEFVWKDTENPFCSRVYLLAPLGVLFTLKTGVRVGEMLAACHEDISEDGKWIHIQRQYRYETDEIADYTTVIASTEVMMMNVWTVSRRLCMKENVLITCDVTASGN